METQAECQQHFSVLAGEKKKDMSSDCLWGVQQSPVTDCGVYDAILKDI